MRKATTFLIPVLAIELVSALGTGLGQRKIDRAVGVADAEGKWVWYDCKETKIEGQGWSSNEQLFDRLPADSRQAVPPAYWLLARQPAGVTVRFVSDADRINLRWTVSSSDLALPHMSATGVSGLDVYLDNGGQWRWLRVAFPRARTTEWLLASEIPPGTHHYLIYLPLYNGLESLQIGVPPSAWIAKPPEAEEALSPVCFYGTSIVQGACASRAGMTYPSILGRRLHRPVINLGFNGEGRMEPELAQLMAELPAAAFVLDGVPNMKPQEVIERAEKFVLILRKKQPATPIILLESMGYLSGWFLPNQRRLYEPSNNELRKVYERLRAKRVKALFYVPRESLVKRTGEGTVDGLHPSDLGFEGIANTLEPLLKSILR